jgi:hypothetical protein
VVATLTYEDADGVTQTLTSESDIISLSFDSSGGISGGTLFAIAISSIFGVGLLVLAIIWFKKHHGNSLQKRDKKAKGEAPTSD